jgi:hypothetical protein
MENCGGMGEMPRLGTFVSSRSKCIRPEQIPLVEGGWGVDNGGVTFRRSNHNIIREG